MFLGRFLRGRRGAWPLGAGYVRLVGGVSVLLWSSGGLGLMAGQEPGSILRSQATLKTESAQETQESQTTQVSPTLILLEASIVDVDSGSVSEALALGLAGDEIVYVGPADALSAPSGVPRIHLDGAFVVPGFWDMHVHITRRRAEELSGPLMVANGVLYARDLISDCVGGECRRSRTVQESRELQRAVAAGDVLAPHLVGLGSIPVEGPKVAYGRRGRPREPTFLAPSTAEQGRQMVRDFADRGVDFIKAYDSFPKPAYLAAIDEAKQVGLSVVGHVPKSLLLREAIVAGHRSVEHARMLPVACSVVEQEVRDAYLAWAELSPEEAEQAPERAAELRERARFNRFYGDVVSGFDEERCATLLEVWADSDSWYVPTHLTRLAEAIVHTRPYLEDPRADYLPKPQTSFGWGREAKEYGDLFAADPAMEQAYMAFHERGLELTGRAFAAGVRLLVGTDSGDTLIYPGFSFHDEMALMVRGGVPPAAVLRAATLGAAEFVGLEASAGRVAVGQRASFVVLDDNPLLDIEGSRSIRAVHHQGRYHDRAALDTMLETVREKAAAFFRAPKRAESGNR